LWIIRGRVRPNDSSFLAATQIAPGGAITQADADALNDVSRLQGAEIGYLQAISTALTPPPVTSSRAS
jgi:hypothetical protein